MFQGANTAFAYYDAAAGTHLEVAKAVAKAKEVAKNVISRGNLTI